eukprot:355468-Hanusia_phi.AAC.1
MTRYLLGGCYSTRSASRKGREGIEERGERWGGGRGGGMQTSSVRSEFFALATRVFSHHVCKAITPMLSTQHRPHLTHSDEEETLHALIGLRAGQQVRLPLSVLTWYLCRKASQANLSPPLPWQTFTRGAGRSRRKGPVSDGLSQGELAVDVLPVHLVRREEVLDALRSLLERLHHVGCPPAIAVPVAVVLPTGQLQLPP